MKFKVKYPTLKVSDEQLIEDLKRIAHILNSPVISVQDYKEQGKYAYTSFRNHFGTWKKALEIAGLSRKRNCGTTKEDYLNNLKEIWIKLGRQPKYSEMAIPFSNYSSTAYAHFFGNWTKALEEFEKCLNADEDISIEPTDDRNIIKTHKTQRSISWRTRFLVMRKDNFKCKACGRAPATDPSVVLHVDHIKAWASGGETVLDNLQTLCSRCNIGKSDLE